MEINIRLEKPEEYREVENLTREAFWNVYRPGCMEH
jgi:predicted N-acetyltransferase YhbS